jgi:hypothetical protein
VLEYQSIGVPEKLRLLMRSGSDSFKHFDLREESLNRHTSTHSLMSQFHRLDAAIIDASSIIYARKVGILPCLSRMIRLFSTPETIEEAGEDAIGVNRLDCDTPLVSNDRKLILCASRFEFAIISEDRQILAAARREGISYFNTLMMLNFLLSVETIDDRAYGRYLEKLRQIAWYGPEIWEFGRNIQAAISKGRQQQE